MCSKTGFKRRVHCIQLFPFQLLAHGMWWFWWLVVFGLSPVKSAKSLALCANSPSVMDLSDRNFFICSNTPPGPGVAHPSPWGISGGGGGAAGIWCCDLF